jgi:hypothetical protein
MPRMLRPLLLALVILSCLALPAPGWAHVPDPPVPSRQGAAVPAESIDPETALPVPVPSPAAPTGAAAGGRPSIDGVALAALAAVAAAALSRRAMSGALAALLMTLAFETAVHSVHHLGSDPEMARCAVAAAATHLSGTIEPPPAPDRPAARSADTPPVAPAAPVPQLACPVLGRAPPLVS